MKWFLMGIAFLLCMAFVVLTKYEDRKAIRDIDLAVTVKIQESIDTSSRLRMAALIGNVFEGAGLLGGPVTTSLAVVVLSGYRFLKSKRGWKRWMVFVIPLSFAVIVVVEILAKAVVHHPPPPFFMIKNPVSTFPKYHVSEEFSFPSGHAARAVFLGILFYSQFIIHNSLFKRLTLRMLAVTGIVGYIILVSVSRIYLGHHWFSDVAGGLLLGSAVGVLTWAILPPYNKPTMSD